MRTVITGAGSGIGLAIARELAGDPDARIGLVDRNPKRGERHCAQLRAGGAEVFTVPGEMTAPDMGTNVIEAAVRKMGGIDALVHAAGSIGNRAPLSELSLEDYEAGFAINTRPLFLLAQAAYPALRQAKGAIVAISSTGATCPVADLGSYSPSKAALSMLAQQMALEWGPDGIRVNTVSPGPTATPMAAAYDDPAIREQRASTIPLRRLSEPKDIAATVAFLLGPGGRGITGTDILVDGGMGLTTMQLSGAALGRMKS